MKQVQRLVTTVLFALFLSAGGVGAQGVSSVRVVGFSDLQDSPLPVQREAAIQDALRNAVQQVVGVLLSTSTLVENYELVEDRIFSRAAGIALLSGIIEEGVAADGLYRVVAEVVVRESDLAEELHSVIRANGNPKVLVEASGGGHATRTLAVAAIQEALVQRGFSVVVGAISPLAEGAGRRALHVGAELVVGLEIDELENVGAPDVLRGAGLASVTVSLVTRLVESASNRLVAVERASSTRVGSGPIAAAREAAQQAATSIGKTISEAAVGWIQESGASERLAVIRLEGAFEFGDVQQLAAEIELRYRISTSIRTFNTQYAEIEVSAGGRIQAILEVLTDAAWKIVALDGMHITARRD